MFLSGNIIGVSQTNTIDSLKSSLSVSPDSIKSKIFLGIAKEYRVTNYDSVFFYGNKAIDYAFFSNDKEMIIESLIEMAYVNISIGNIERSENLYNQAKEICLEEENNYLLAKIYIDLERYYTTLSDYAGSICSLDTALNIIDNNNFSDLRPIIYSSYSNLYLIIHDYSIAKYYANLAIRYSKNETDKANFIGNKLLLGKIFFLKSELDSAFYYYNGALALAKSTNKKILIQESYRKLSAYYIEISEYDIANLYIDSSIFYCNELGLSSELASLFTFKAHIFSLKGDYKNTLKYNFQALGLRLKLGDKKSICSSLLNIGGDYTHLGDYDKAHIYLNRGIRIAIDLNTLFYLATGYDKLSELNKLEGNYKEALYFTELKTLYNDSIIAKRTNDKVMFLKTQFESEKERTISDKIKLKKKTRESFFLIIIVILSIGIIILLSWLNYLKQKTNKEIRKAKEKAEESEFFFKESQNAANIGSYNFDYISNTWNSSEVLDRIFDIDKNYNRTFENWINIIHIDDREIMSKYFMEDVVSKHQQFNKEYRITRRSNGETRWVLGMGVLHFDDDGKVVSMIGTVQDITNRKMVEAELLEYREHLEKMVKERTIDLEDKNKELERLNNLFVGREFRIKELRDKIKELEKRQFN